MRIDIVTIFPDFLREALSHSIIGRALSSGAADVQAHDLRDYASDRHRTVDDSPYGGGPGMVMKPEPFFLAVEDVVGQEPAHVVLLTPQGRVFTQQVARELAAQPRLVLLCGHYEGVDERVLSIVDEEISMGDYVLTGGELPAMVIADCVARLIPGVLPDEAPVYDSFEKCLLDWECYTRPEVFNGMRVPDVLLSGNHGQISDWRRKRALERTRERRPDLYDRFLKRKS